MPELSSSLEKYLRCIKPIISEASYKYTESVVAEFAKPNGIGHKLQDILIEKANQVDNWVIFLMSFLHLTMKYCPTFEEFHLRNKSFHSKVMKLFEKCF